MVIYLEPSLKPYADSQSIKEERIGVLASEEGLGADSMTGGRTVSRGEKLASKGGAGTKTPPSTHGPLPRQAPKQKAISPSPTGKPFPAH